MTAAPTLPGCCLLNRRWSQHLSMPSYRIQARQVKLQHTSYVADPRCPRSLRNVTRHQRAAGLQLSVGVTTLYVFELTCMQFTHAKQINVPSDNQILLNVHVHASSYTHTHFELLTFRHESQLTATRRALQRRTSATTIFSCKSA